MRETNKDATMATTTVRERDMNMIEKQKGVTMITMDKRKGHEYDEETKEGRRQGSCEYSGGKEAEDATMTTRDKVNTSTSTTETQSSLPASSGSGCERQVDQERLAK